MKRTLPCCVLGFFALVLEAATPPVSAQTPAFPSNPFAALSARPIGPANMGGRITDLAVVAARPSTFFVATASGGVWRTTNAGITWSPVFEDHGTSAIGALAVAPSKPDVVWVGTGEANARNSVSWGDGVYQSTDGGKTWKHRGLRETHHIGRIVIHPQDPNTVYVAALGRLWGPNKERGVFKTSNGGQTWEHVLALDENTGCVDLACDPCDPLILYAAAFQVRRGAYSGGDPVTQFGKAAGLYRTRNGGKTWQRLSKGLPDRPIGRCGIDVYRKDPRVLYAVVHTDKTGNLTILGQPASANNAKVEAGGVFRSEDYGETWVKVNDLCPRPFYFGQIRVDPTDDKNVWVLGIFLHVSRDGGKNFRNDGAPGVHADHHALWINPTDPEHLILGCDGGLYFSHDRGANWEHVRNLPIGQFYAVGVDLRKPYRVYGGLQDNGSWGGPSRTYYEEGITAADWVRVLGADGFYCQVDPNEPDIVYAEGQYGMLRRVNVRSGKQTDLVPSPATLLSPSYRFNWCAPLLLSPHNSRVLYYGGNHVFRSLDRGDRWEVTSPDLTRGKPGKDPTEGKTLSALAESPLKPGVVWAGSDDGRVHVSRNGGVEWTEVSARIPGVPPERHITRIECSPFAAGTAWLTLDRHRQDDRAPYIFRTDDHGRSWRPLANNLPTEGPVYVVRASDRNRDLLFAGTEHGLYVTLDGGEHWQRLRNGLPTVPVHDLVIHPRERELVIGTHGRSIYIMDVAPLEGLTAAVRSAEAHLFEVKPAIAYEPRDGRELVGGKNYVAANPPYGAAVWYHLREKSSRLVKVVITDPLGRVMADLTGSPLAGLHPVYWTLRGGAGIDLLRGARLVPAGDYVARLMIGERAVMSRKVRVEAEE
jgi:photosystem II stability/assembly factor-like uncharacterized protein